MISAIARTVKSIANFQRALDIGMEDPTARVQEEAVQEAVKEAVQEAVQEMVKALEDQDVAEEEVHPLGKRKNASTVSSNNLYSNYKH